MSKTTDYDKEEMRPLLRKGLAIITPDGNYALTEKGEALAELNSGSTAALKVAELLRKQPH